MLIYEWTYDAYISISPFLAFVQFLLYVLLLYML